MRPADAPPPLDALLAQREWVHALARRLVSRDDRADDVEQAMWTAAVERPPADARSARGWLAVALRNAARKLGRSESRRAHHESAARTEAAALPDRAARAARPPDEIVAETELQRKVARAVSELPPAMRDVLLLRYYEDLAPAAIAERLGVPVETVRTRHRRGIERLRERLDSEHRGGRAEWAAIVLSWDAAGPGGTARRVAPIAAAAGALAFLPKFAAALVVVGILAFGARELLTPADGDGTDSAGADPSPRGTTAGPSASSLAATPRPTPHRPAEARLDVTVRRDGRPVAARIVVRDEPAAPPPRFRADFDADTADFLREALRPSVAEGDAGSDGAARFDGLAPGRRIVEAADASGRSAAVRVVVAGDALSVTIDLPAAAPDLAGRIVAPDGPFHGRFAVVPNDWRPSRDAAPDWRPAGADGSFAWSGQLRGRARLLVCDPAGFVDSSAPFVVPREKPLDVRIDRPPARNGLVRESGTHRPVASATVTWGTRRADGSTRAGLATTDAAGTFVAACGVPTEFRAFARDFGTAKRDDSADVGGDVVLEMSRAATVTGHVVRDDDGRAVAGVTVRAIEHEPSDGKFDCGTLSAADGSFTLTGVPPRTVQVFAAGAGWTSPGIASLGWRPDAGNPHVLEVPADGVRDLVLAVERAASVVVRVTDDSGTPVAGAEVVVGAPGWDLIPRRGASGADGRVTVTALPPGVTFDIVATTHVPERLGTAASGALAAGADTPVEVRLAPVRRVTVRVADAVSGAPVRGADVLPAWGVGNGSNSNPAERVRTDDSGVADVPVLHPGRFGVRVSAPGFADDSIGAGVMWLEPEDATSMTVRMHRAARLAGRIELPEGVRASEVYVRVRGDGALGFPRDVPTSLAADGSVEFDELAAGRCHVSAFAKSGGRSWTGEVRVEAPSDGFTLTLAERSGPAPVRLRVTGPNGAPVVGGYVWSLFRGGSSTGGGLDHSEVRVTPRGEPFRVIVCRPTDAQGRALPLGFAEAVVGPGESGDRELRLPAERRITGRVTDDAGRPVRGALVQAMLPGSVRDRVSIYGKDLADAWTRPDGTFTLGRLGKGRVVLVVRPPAGLVAPESREVATDAGSADFTLRARVAPWVTVTDIDGAPLPGCTVYAVWEAGWSHDTSSTVTTASDGRARIPDLDPGRELRLMVQAPGRLDVSDTQIDGWKAADTTVALRRAGVVSCRVTDDAGRPVAGATVRVRAESTGGGATSHTDADGRAAIGGLPESGEVEIVSADSQGFARATGEVRRVAVGSRDVPLALRGPLLRVRIEGRRESLGIDGLRVHSADGAVRVVAPIEGEHVVVAGLAAGSKVSLRTGGTDREDATAWADDVEIGPDGAQMTLVVARGLPIAGRLDGAPDAIEIAGHAGVGAVSGGFRWTGDLREGRFRFPSLPPGEYRIEFVEDDWIAVATVQAGAEDLVLTLRRRE